MMATPTTASDANFATAAPRVPLQGAAIIIITITIIITLVITMVIIGILARRHPRRSSLPVVAVGSLYGAWLLRKPIFPIVVVLVDIFVR
jgi:hypothetical protein